MEVRGGSDMPDIIVIGASAGGVSALAELVKGFPSSRGITSRRIFGGFEVPRFKD